MIDSACRRTRQLMEARFYCAESVLLAAAESKGIESDVIPRIATGFCGGMARTCGTCGAVTGGIMAIGLFSGRNSPEEPVDGAYILVRKLLEMFEARFGSTNCKHLTGCDLGTEEGRDYFHSNNLFERCKVYAEEATRMTMSLVKEKPVQ